MTEGQKVFKRYTKAAMPREIAPARKKIKGAERTRHQSKRLTARNNHAKKSNFSAFSWTRREASEKLPRQDHETSREPQLLFIRGSRCLSGKSRGQRFFNVSVANAELWMQRADYPGRRRRPQSKPKGIPQRTLLEAAQLAAFYKPGKSQPKGLCLTTQKIVIK